MATPGRLGERVWAGVALLSLVLAVATTVVGAAAHLGAILVALAGLLVVVSGGWYAVTRTGLGRGAALVGVAAGALVALVGIVGTTLSSTRVLTVAVLGAVSVGSARLALRRSVRDVRRQAQAAPVAPTARRPVLIINPKSGGGKAERFHLVDECRSRGIETAVLGPGDDLVEVAEAEIARGADVIGMAGGDGSQALVAAAAIRHDIPHVVIPAGTWNHLALDLGIDRDDVVGALDAFSDGVEDRVDVATVNGRLFVNNASVGIYAKVVQSPEYRDAKRATVAAMLPDMLGPTATPLDLRFTGPDGEEQPDANVIMVSNDPYQLDLRRGRGTRQRLDQGMLGVVAIRIANAAEFTRFLAYEAIRRSDRFPGLLEWTAPDFRIDSHGPVEVGLDGEALVLDPPLVFRTMPQALRVRLPRRALRRSPAALAVHVLSQSTIVELARLTIGR